MSDEAAQRRAARAHWPVVKTTLAEQDDSADLRATTTMDERFAMVWRLTRDAWALSGREMPKYERSEMPTTFVRGRH